MDRALSGPETVRPQTRALSCANQARRESRALKVGQETTLPVEAQAGGQTLYPDRRPAGVVGRHGVSLGRAPLGVGSTIQRTAALSTVEWTLQRPPNLSTILQAGHMGQVPTTAVQIAGNGSQVQHDSRPYQTTERLGLCLEGTRWIIGSLRHGRG